MKAQETLKLLFRKGDNVGDAEAMACAVQATLYQVFSMDEAPIAKHFQDFIQITDEECQESLLQGLIDKQLSLKEFVEECSSVKRRMKTQNQFARQTNSGT